MNQPLLISWIGNTDLRVASGELKNSLGPLGQAVRDRPFGQVHLLSDHPAQETKSYVAWLRRQTSTDVVTHTVKLSGPTEFSEIYEAAVRVVHGLSRSQDSPPRFVYHLSPGTPAMAAVWILLAKTIHPGELIESSQQHGVRTVSFPFDVSADYLPHIVHSDEDITRLTQGLPPEVAEFGAIVHRSPEMKRLIAEARVIAVHDVPVLIQGESGTGKELISRAIHKSSSRASGPFIEVNCGAIPADLVEREFFGHTKGAFTGAHEANVGYLEAADGGTLFLDEIGELPLPAQVKLLRTLQEKAVQRVGATKPKRIDIRVIAATNRNLADEVAEKRFREDLFHRLAVGVLRLPPLRERSGDLNLLIDHALARINSEGAAKPGWVHKKISAAARNLLAQHPWRGNVRELFNTLSRTAIWSTGETIDADAVRRAMFAIQCTAGADNAILNRPLGNGFSLPDVLGEVAQHYLSRAYSESKGVKSQAYGLVGLPNYQTFSNWLKKYGVET